jgi:hypothetical protein
MRTALIILMASAMALQAPIFNSGGAQRRARVNRHTSPADQPPPPPLASGQGYFVATNGTIGAAGDIDNPWSWAYARTQQVWRATDLIVVRSGTYQGAAKDLFGLGRTVMFYGGGPAREVRVEADGVTSFRVVNPVEPPELSGGIYVNTLTIEKP